jgi:hypothetical protein
VIRRRPAGSFASLAAATRAAVNVGQGMDAALSARELSGPAAAHWAGAIASVRDTLRRLEAEGWEWLVGGAGEAGRGGLGRDSIAKRKAGVDVVARAFAR